MNKGAKLSNDRNYRYQLWRIWDEKLPTIAFVGLNPSFADEDINDPTISRCIDFTKKWGYGGFYMLNLFAYISTNPNELFKTLNPVGFENDKTIKEVIKKVDKVICVWGNNGTLLNRNNEVLSFIKEPYCLKINANGQPAHPLYLKNDLIPFTFEKMSTTEIGNEKTQEYDENPFIDSSTKEKKITKSNYLYVESDLDKNKYEHYHWLKQFKANESLLFRISINDVEIFFKQSDEIVIGTETVYWYISRIGNYYTKSNDEIDAEHIGETFYFNRSDVKHWKAICIQTTVFLEAELKNGDRYYSIGIPFSELNILNELQLLLNRIK